VKTFSTQIATQVTSFYKYIKSVNDDEQHYESSGLWGHRILSPGREQTSIKSDIKVKSLKTICI